MSSWFDDVNDCELRDLVPFLEELAKCDNVYGLLQAPSNGAITGPEGMEVTVSETDVITSVSESKDE